MKAGFSKAFLSVVMCVLLVSAFGVDDGMLKTVDSQIESLLKSKTDFRRIVEFLEKRVAEESVKTNAALRVHIDRKILSFCSMPPWTQFSRWDKKWSEQRIPALCEREIASADCPSADKLEFLRALSLYEAGKGDYVSSLATAKKAFLLDGLGRRELFEAHRLLADAYRWADRYEEAKSEYRKASAIDSIKAANLLADLAADYGRESDVEDAWTGMADPCHRLLWYAGRENAKAGEDALRYIVDEKHPVKNRRDILARYFSVDKTERGEQARLIAGGFDYSGYWNWDVFNGFTKVYRFGDWALFVKIAEAFRTMAYFNDPGRYRAYLFSLIAVGRAEDAVELSERFLQADAVKSRSALKALDRVKFEMIKALAEKRDLAAVAKAAGLPARQYAEAILTAAQWTLNLQRNEECERYSAMYKSLFKEMPERSYKVKFFDRPVCSIAAWRGVSDALEKSYVDIKMCGELDSLETDVATGRAEVEKTSLDSGDSRMEITSFCDVEGLKIVMRVVDKNARAVENGFAGGMATECYFAPGENEPYICFSSAPKEGVGFVFYTAYSSAYSTRVDFNGGKSSVVVRQEREFTDNDYVLMISFPWRAFYRKFPVSSGARWRFECLADGYSWGGSQGVHESSSWGNLVFDLKAREISAIRRRLVYDTYKAWNLGGRDNISVFERWRDPVVGDVEFYEEALKPLEEDLKAQAAKVKSGMTDEEVDEVYFKGAEIWMGIDHAVDELRRIWLLDKLTGN